MCITMARDSSSAYMSARSGRVRWTSKTASLAICWRAHGEWVSGSSASLTGKGRAGARTSAASDAARRCNPEDEADGEGGADGGASPSGSNSRSASSRSVDGSAKVKLSGGTGGAQTSTMEAYGKPEMSSRVSAGTGSGYRGRAGDPPPGGIHVSAYTSE